MTNTLTNQEEIIGKVLKLFISQKGNSTRVVKEKLYLDSNGIRDDKFYNKDTNRSVLMSSLRSYHIAQDHNIVMSHGSLGENILMDYNPYNLLLGTKIKIGEATLEITQNCTLCKSLTQVDNKLPKVLKDDRGIFAKVISSGTISQNDKVILLKSED